MLIAIASIYLLTGTTSLEILHFTSIFLIYKGTVCMGALFIPLALKFHYFISSLVTEAHVEAPTIGSVFWQQ